jgi:hypothetical protein
MLKRASAGVIFSLTSAVAMADAPMCGDMKPNHDELLSSQDWRLVARGQSNGDLVLAEAAAVETRKGQDAPLLVKNTKRITWDQARKLVLLGAVSKVVQSHDLSVQLTTRLKKVYVTREPKIDDIVHLVKVVDPCQVFVHAWTE